MTTNKTPKSRLQTIRKVSKYIVGSSVHTTIALAVKQNTVPANKLQAVELVIGSFMLGSIASSKATDVTDKYFDSLEERLNKNKESVPNVTSI